MRFPRTECGVTTSYKRVPAICAYMPRTASAAVHEYVTEFMPESTTLLS